MIEQLTNKIKTIYGNITQKAYDLKIKDMGHDNPSWRQMKWVDGQKVYLMYILIKNIGHKNITNLKYNLKLDYATVKPTKGLSESLPPNKTEVLEVAIQGNNCNDAPKYPPPKTLYVNYDQIKTEIIHHITVNPYFED